jgi:hypothetical protein
MSNRNQVGIEKNMIILITEHHHINNLDNVDMDANINTIMTLP